MNAIRCALLFTATLASAADLAGTWKFEAASMSGPNVRRRMTIYVFKTDGAKFTGTFATLTERRDIINGTIDGNQIAFETHFEFDDPGRNTPFKGEINGDELKITPARPPTNGRSPQVTAVRKVSDETAFVPPPELVRIHKPFEPFKPDPRFASAFVEFGSWHVLAQ